MIKAYVTVEIKMTVPMVISEDCILNAKDTPAPMLKKSNPKYIEKPRILLAA
jgi:hypothetical protein